MMKKILFLALAFIYLESNEFDIDSSLKGFSLTKEEQQRLKRLKKARDEFFKKYPEFLDIKDEIEFIDYKLEKKFIKRKLSKLSPPQEKEISIPDIIASEFPKDFKWTKEDEERLKKLQELKRKLIKKFPELKKILKNEDVVIMDYEFEKELDQRKRKLILQKEEQRKKELLEKEKEIKRLKEKQKKARELKAKKEKLKKLLQSPLYKALILYKQKKYKAAYSAFYKLFENDMQNARVNFYLGLCASRLKHYEDAVSAFERVLIKEPNHLRAKLEHAKALFFLKDIEGSEKEFREVLKTKKLPKAVVKTIYRFLAFIEKTKIRNKFNFIAMVGLKYDNNINNDIGKGTPIDDTSIPDEGNSEVSDVLHEEMLMINHTYDFGKIGGYYWQNSVMAFLQNYSGKSYTTGTEKKKTDEKNIIFTSISTGVGTKSKSYNYFVKLHHDDIKINNIKILQVNGLQFSCSKPISKKYTASLKAKYQQKDNISDDNSDATYYEINPAIKIKRSKKDTISFDISYASEDAKVDEEKDNIALFLKAGYNYIYTKKFSTTYSYKYKTLNYAKKSVTYKDKRSDKQHNINITGVYKIKPTIMLNGGLSYTKNSSTRDSNTYDKYVINISSMFVF